MADPRLTYRVRFAQPATHLYEMTLEIEHLAPGRHRLEMAVWTPGSYLVREFAGHVHRLRAEDGAGAAVAVTKERKNVWAFDAPADGHVRVRYEVYANEPTVDTSHLDASHAYWNGASLFFSLDDRKDLPVEIEVEAPAHWHVSTGLDVLEDRGGHIRLGARDFDTLIDGPVEIGSHRRYTFEVLGRPHELALYGHGNEDPERLVRDLSRIVEAAAAVFGGLPYDRYVFIVHLLDERGGGLEHKNSTTCDVRRFAFRPEAEYLATLPLFSHEFFHLWNVKRIRPRVLGPFDYGSEAYTRLLWAMEGITDYYADLLLVRAGVWTERKYAQALASQIRDYEGRPGRLAQSASDASFDTWIKFYRPNEASPNHTISYYQKGSLLGLCLDLELRGRSGGARGLDDVLRLLWERFGRHDRGFEEGEFRAAAEEVAGTALDEFWRRYVDGTEPLDVDAYLAHAGLTVERDWSRTGEDDANRRPDAPRPPSGGGEARAFLGVVPTREAGRLRVRHVLAGAPAEIADVEAGDEIVGVDGWRLDDVEGLRARLADHAPGDAIRLTLARRGELIERQATLGASLPDRYRVVAKATPSPVERAVHQSWLGCAYPPPDGLESETPPPSPRAFTANLV
jgi:predicted metalloprotease with PDZ domain